MSTYDSYYGSDFLPRFCSTFRSEDGKHTVWVHGKNFGEYVITDCDGGLKLTCGVCGESLQDPESPEGLNPSELPHAADCLWVERFKQLDSEE